MGRLIYADKLKTDLEKAISKNEDMDCLVFLCAASVIDAQPTAYDPDKVVEQLEDYNMWREFLIYELTYRERQIIKRVTDIVKGEI